MSIRIAVLVSGGGTNLQAILDADAAHIAQLEAQSAKLEVSQADLQKRMNTGRMINDELDRLAATAAELERLTAQLLGKDYVYACKTVVLSTLLSLVTMPLIVLLAQTIIR